MCYMQFALQTSVHSHSRLHLIYPPDLERKPNTNALASNRIVPALTSAEVKRESNRRTEAVGVMTQTCLVAVQLMHLRQSLAGKLQVLKAMSRVNGSCEQCLHRSPEIQLAAACPMAEFPVPEVEIADPYLLAVSALSHLRSGCYSAVWLRGWKGAK